MMDRGALLAGLVVISVTWMNGVADWCVAATALVMPVTASAPATVAALASASVFLLSFIVFPSVCGERPSGPAALYHTGRVRVVSRGGHYCAPPGEPSGEPNRVV